MTTNNLRTFFQIPSTLGQIFRLFPLHTLTYLVNVAAAAIAPPISHNGSVCCFLLAIQPPPTYNYISFPYCTTFLRCAVHDV